MPLSGVSRRTGALGAFTFRELLAQRRALERAARRGRSIEAAPLLARIEAELAERRVSKLERAGRPVEP